MATALYDAPKVAELYARHRGNTDELFIDEVVSLLGQSPGPVVDIGAGSGTPAAALAHRGLDVVCVEPSSAMILQGRLRYPNLRYVQAVGEALPFDAASFESATLLYVLHHTRDPELVLGEARRVLRPNGRLVVVSGSTDCARQRLFARYFPSLVPDLIDPGEIRAYSRAAGLEPVEVRRTHHWIYPNRTIDAEYVEMVSTEMFAALRALAPEEFASGVERLRTDIGRPLPPAEVTLVVLEAPGRHHLLAS